MSIPIVSVSMLTYNHAPYIVDAIEGILSQKTNYKFELLIGEDCSTDGTRDIVFNYQKRFPDKVRVITSDTNVGAKKNSNRVRKACRGKYLAFCEGDDKWHDNEKLQLQVDFLENNPEYGLVYSDYDKHFVKKNHTIKNFIHAKATSCPQPPSITEILNAKTGIQTCTVLTEKELVDQLKSSDDFLYSSGSFLMGDTQLWAEISTLKKIHYIDKSLATHRILSESATQSNNIKKILKFRISGSKLCVYLSKKHNQPEWLLNTHQDIINILSLKLAFIENDVDHSKIIWKQIKNKKLKHFVFYYCTLFPLLRKLVIPFYLPFEKSKW